MKKSIKKTVTLIILLMTVSLFSFGQKDARYEYRERSKQEHAKMERTRNLQFKNESEKAEVKVKVSDEFNFLKINVGCHLKQGDVRVEIFDPSGELKANLKILSESNLTKGKNTTIKESVNGEIEKAYRNPMKGDWIVRVTPENATGNVRINNILIYNPRSGLLELREIEKNTDSNIR